MSGNYLFDLDGTLAEYHGWNGGEIGEPVESMIALVKQYIRDGKDVRVFTARVSPIVDMMLAGNLDPVALEKLKWKIAQPILDWCEKHIGKQLPITCMKDFHTVEIYDDRCHRVEANTGRVLA